VFDAAVLERVALIFTATGVVSAALVQHAIDAPTLSPTCSQQDRPPRLPSSIEGGDRWSAGSS